MIDVSENEKKRLLCEMYGELAGAHNEMLNLRKSTTEDNEYKFDEVEFTSESLGKAILRKKKRNPNQIEYLNAANDSETEDQNDVKSSNENSNASSEDSASKKKSETSSTKSTSNSDSDSESGKKQQTRKRGKKKNTKKKKISDLPTTEEKEEGEEEGKEKRGLKSKIKSKIKSKLTSEESDSEKDAIEKKKFAGKVRDRIEKRKERKAEERELDQEEIEFWTKAPKEERHERMKFMTEEEKVALKDRLFGRKKKAKRKKARIEFELYAVVFFTYLFVGNLIPLALVLFYLAHVLHPIFQRATYPVYSESTSVFAPITEMDDIFMNFVEIFQDPAMLVIVLTAPLVLLGIYLLRQYLCALTGKMIYGFFNWIRPRKELNKANFMGEDADDVNIYHTRNFLLRILKWQFQKSPFPWMTPWMYNFVGSNKLGKNVTVEEGLFTLEFLETGDNVYMGPMAGTTTHFVEGSYQSLTVKGVNIEDNCVVGARNCISPGVHMEEDSQMFSFSGVTKLIRVPAGTDNFGMPASRLTYSKYQDFMNFPKDVKKEDKKIQKERRRKIKRARRKARRNRENRED